MGETGADDPIQATDDGLREFAANEIVIRHEARHRAPTGSRKA